MYSFEMREVSTGQSAVLRDIFRVCQAIKSRIEEYETEKVFTIVGAAIFYGPKDKARQYRGRSRAAEPGNEVMDHVYSRKESARYFMAQDFSFEEFERWYWERASIWVYVTRQENRILMRFQQKGDAYEIPWQETYRRAGIELIRTVDNDPLNRA